MEVLGFTSEEIVNILKIVASVLKLGNICFVPSNNIDGTEGCAINNDYGKLFFSCEVDHLLSFKSNFVNDNHDEQKTKMLN